MSEVFERYSAYVEKYKDLILDSEKYLYSVPELGFKEFKTSAYLEKEFEKLGYTLTRAGDVPGFYTVADTGREGPTVLVFGELDAVVCAEHPCSDKTTGAVHSCGHNCQTSALLGIAAALKEEGALDGLCGRIKLCAVPAEELLDTEYREDLRKKGVIKYFGGKVEFMRRGYFDDCDLAFMVHTMNGDPHKIYMRKVANGCINKNIVFKGKAAHAGGAPHRGINALYAATNALNVINALREKNIDGEYNRIHSIITDGGQMVNAIPSKVKMESQIRGVTVDAIKRVNNDVNRAIAASAAAIGASVEIHDRPGYSPLCADDTLMETARKAGLLSTDDDKVKVSSVIGGGCSDMGDIMSVMPAIHPYVSGSSGTSHGADYYITDPESATVFSAKFQLVLIHELLCDGAKEAKRVIENASPAFKSKAEYFEAFDSFFKDKEAVIYNEDGKITLDF